MKNKTLRFLIVGLAVLAAAALAASCGSLTGAKQSAPAGEQSASANVESDTLAEEDYDVISSSGTILPAQRATLSLPAGGVIAHLNVKAGDAVQTGQVLLDLDAAILQGAVDAAQANLAASQAARDELVAGARPEERAAAKAALAQAQANLSGAQAGVSAAQQALKGAEAQAGISQAAAELANAELTRVQAGPGPETIAAAKAQMEKADAVRSQAQSEYDKIAWSSSAGATPQGAALQQATADYQAAKANYEALRAQPRPADVAGAKAAQAQAQAAFAAARQAIETARPAVEQAQSAAQAAQAGVEAAQAQLDQVIAGATAEQLAAAEAGVEAAQAALSQAQAALAQSQLKAPFAGTVGEIFVRQGEMVTPAMPLLDLGDLSHLRVETTDLNEIDLYKLPVGQAVKVTFDALPARSVTGKVIEVAPKATRGQAGTNFTVIVELEENEPLLRWGMTAFVDAVIE